jgi:hypothetical protein
LALPDASAASDATAASVREQCQAFLLHSGYELARVETTIENGHIRVDVDEGRLQKIVFRGTGSLRTVQALIALNLPQGVFNRPYLERQIARIKREHGVDVAGWQLVVSTEHRKIGPEIADLKPLVKPLSPLVAPIGTLAEGIGTLVGHSLIPQRADYELHILFPRRAWSQGVGLVASLGGADGLKLGLRYKNEALLVTTDRWAAEGTVGMATRTSLRDQHSYVAIQRAAAAASWFSPPLLGELRPALVLRGELTSRQRPDVGLESYQVTRVQAGLALSYDLSVGRNVSLGFGAERDDVLSLEQIEPMAAPLVPSGTYNQPYIDTAMQFTFDPDEIRADRRHEFAVGGRQRLAIVGSAYGVATYRYQCVIPVGWHDIWLTSHGGYVWGDAPFFEEQPVGGTHIRGVFTTRFFARRVVSAGLDLRYSLVRDVYKVGGFFDSALFGEILPERRHDRTRVVGGVGPSFHALIADAFQLNMFYAFGLASRGVSEHAFAATLNQAF